MKISCINFGLVLVHSFVPNKSTVVRSSSGATTTDVEKQIADGDSWSKWKDHLKATGAFLSAFGNGRQPSTQDYEDLIFNGIGGGVEVVDLFTDVDPLVGIGLGFFQGFFGGLLQQESVADKIWKRVMDKVPKMIKVEIIKDHIKQIKNEADKNADLAAFWQKETDIQKKVKHAESLNDFLLEAATDIFSDECWNWGLGSDACREWNEHGLVFFQATQANLHLANLLNLALLELELPENWVHYGPSEMCCENCTSASSNSPCHLYHRKSDGKYSVHASSLEQCRAECRPQTGGESCNAVNYDGKTCVFRKCDNPHKPGISSLSGSVCEVYQPSSVAAANYKACHAKYTSRLEQAVNDFGKFRRGDFEWGEYSNHPYVSHTQCRGVSTNATVRKYLRSGSVYCCETNFEQTDLWTGDEFTGRYPDCNGGVPESWKQEMTDGSYAAWALVDASVTDLEHMVAAFADIDTSGFPDGGNCGVAPLKLDTLV